MTKNDQNDPGQQLFERYTHDLDKNRRGDISSSYGHDNTRVRVAHECVIITKKLHEIPYDTVTHWNEVINPYLHRQLTCSFSTFFPH